MPTNSTIGMSVPGLSPAGQALSLYTGASVADQVNQESEDERRKRLARLAAAQQNGGDTRPGWSRRGWRCVEGGPCRHLVGVFTLNTPRYFGAGEFYLVSLFSPLEPLFAGLRRGAVSPW